MEKEYTINHAKWTPRRADNLRKAIAQIADTDTAIQTDIRSVIENLRFYAKKMGYAVRTKKQFSGGWRAWVYTPKS